MKKKWIQAIRRDEGKDLKISDSTKVCSRHFRDEDLRAYLHADGGPQVGEVTRLVVVGFLRLLLHLQLRTCLHGGGGPQLSEVTRLSGVTCLSV